MFLFSFDVPCSCITLIETLLYTLLKRSSLADVTLEGHTS